MFPLVYTIINVCDMLNRIKMHTSKVGAKTVDKNGVSLYDTIKIYESDEVIVKQSITEAARTIVAKYSDIASFGVSTLLSDEVYIEFHAPDFDIKNQGALDYEVLRFVESSAVSTWLSTLLPDQAKHYAALATESLERIGLIVRHRAPLIRPE